MALPPTIPTSFVPKQPVLLRKSISGFNPFLVVSYFILGIWVVIAGLVFAYQFYLSRVAEQKSEELRTAQNNIDRATVSEFIRLRDRFTTAKDLLNKHHVPSHFFDELENITIQNVRFTSLKLTIKDTGMATVQMQGVARNFNALAAQSTAFAKDKNFKRAIFSGFTLDSKDNSVTFQVNADVDPSLMVDTAGAFLSQDQTRPTSPVASSTPPAQPPTSPVASSTPPSSNKKTP